MSLPFNSPMRIDSKGKYYTKIVSTNRLEVILHLNSGMIIQGAVHIRSDQRLSDELNDIQPFLSVTACNGFAGRGSSVRELLHCGQSPLHRVDSP